MKRFRFSPGEDEETTWPGCLLVLGTALVALLFTVWVAPLYAGPLLGQLDENSFDVVKLVIGAILYSPTVLVGLGFYAGAGALLQLAGIRLFRPQRQAKGIQRAKTGGVDKRSVGELILSEEQGRLVVQSGWREHVSGIVICVLCGPLFGLMACGLAVWEIRKPGRLGADFLTEELGFLRLNPENWLVAILARGCTYLMILLFALLSVLCCRELYGAIVHGRRQWVFDRSRDLLTLGEEPIRSLSSITHVVLTRERVDLNEIYWVSFAPDPKRTQQKGQGTREARFSFARQSDAKEFARTVGSLIHREVVNKLP